MMRGADDPSVPVAATVVIVRDSAAGPEVLMLERPQRGSFAGAWVFPGGKIDPEDAAADGTEESAAHHAAVREVHEEVGLTLQPEALRRLSCWDPPVGWPPRIRTWFFVAEHTGEHLVLSPSEVVDARWMRPLDALAAHGRGEIQLYPPTWVTLHTLSHHTEVARLIEAADLSGIELFESVAHLKPMRLIWHGDADYPDALAPAEARHRLTIDKLPWIYERTSTGK